MVKFIKTVNVINLVYSWRPRFSEYLYTLKQKKPILSRLSESNKYSTTFQLDITQSPAWILHILCLETAFRLPTMATLCIPSQHWFVEFASNNVQSWNRYDYVHGCNGPVHIACLQLLLLQCHSGILTPVSSNCTPTFIKFSNRPPSTEEFWSGKRGFALR
jgi:hypothetical protein